MKRKKIFLAFMALAVLLGTVTGCALRKNTAAPVLPTEKTASGKYDGNVGIQFAENVAADIPADYGSKNVMPHAAVAEEQGIVGTGFANTSTAASSAGTSLDILAQRKVIRNANVSLEVDDFYTAYGNLQAMITGIGYISESNIHRDYYTYENERRSRITGEITIRVDAKHFDNILNDVKGLGEVIDDRIYSTDVTDQYFDTEGRLKVLKIEYEYLEEYMRSLKEPDDIFKTRTRMTELQTEIERLTGTLNKWNNLVELSTIYVRMTEKYPEEVLRKQENTYWIRVRNAFERSITGVVESLGNLLILIIEAIPTLVILVLAGWICYIAARRIRRNINRRSAEKKEKSAEFSETANNEIQA